MQVDVLIGRIKRVHAVDVQVIGEIEVAKTDQRAPPPVAKIDPGVGLIQLDVLQARAIGITQTGAEAADQRIGLRIGRKRHDVGRRVGIERSPGRPILQAEVHTLPGNLVVQAADQLQSHSWLHPEARVAGIQMVEEVVGVVRIESAQAIVGADRPLEPHGVGPKGPVRRRRPGVQQAGHAAIAGDHAAVGQCERRHRLRGSRKYRRADPGAVIGRRAGGRHELGIGKRGRRHRRVAQRWLQSRQRLGRPLAVGRRGDGVVSRSATLCCGGERESEQNPDECATHDRALFGNRLGNNFAGAQILPLSTDGWRDVSEDAQPAEPQLSLPVVKLPRNHPNLCSLRTFHLYCWHRSSYLRSSAFICGSREFSVSNRLNCTTTGLPGRVLSSCLKR